MDYDAAVLPAKEPQQRHSGRLHLQRWHVLDAGFPALPAAAAAAGLPLPPVRLSLASPLTGKPAALGGASHHLSTYIQRPRQVRKLHSHLGRLNVWLPGVKHRPWYRSRESLAAARMFCNALQA